MFPPALFAEQGLHGPGARRSSQHTRVQNAPTNSAFACQMAARDQWRYAHLITIGIGPAYEAGCRTLDTRARPSFSHHQSSAACPAPGRRAKQLPNMLDRKRFPQMALRGGIIQGSRRPRSFMR